MPTTTGAVVELGVKMVAAETSGHGGEISSHHTGKEVAADDPLSFQGQATDAATSEGEEEFELFDHSLGFFAPATVVDSRAFKSRDHVPHPKDIPNRGNVFDDERLERVWWNRVDEIDELRDPTRVVSSFARTAMNVST